MIVRDRVLVALAFAIVTIAPAGVRAQSSAPAQAAAPAEPPSAWRRWIDPQLGTLGTRYRVVENGAGVLTANHVQYKGTLRVRFGIDADRRYSVGLGAVTGSGFTPSWNATGLGTGDAGFDFKVRQLFITATPVDGLELQVGSLYVQRGETTEIIGYDNDGYVAGERVALRMPSRLLFDEIVVTTGYIGDSREPSVFARANRMGEWDYGQVLVTKRVLPALSVTGEYSVLSGQHLVRAAGTIRTRRMRALDLLRVEQYVRVDEATFGFNLEGQKAVAPRVTLGAGLADVDPFAGVLNSDRFGPGRRVYASLSARLAPDLTFQGWLGQAVGETRDLPLKTRFDAVLEFDLLQALTRHGVLR